MTKSTIDPRVRAALPKGAGCMFNKTANRWYVYFEKKIYVKGAKPKSQKEYIGTIRDFVFHPNEHYLNKLKSEKENALITEKAKVAKELSDKIEAVIQTEQIEVRKPAQIVYPLKYILCVSILASMGGHESAEAIAQYWKSHRKVFCSWFRDFPEQSISHDTVRRVLAIMDTERFGKVLTCLAKDLVKQIQKITETKQSLTTLSIDGQGTRASRISEDNKIPYQLNIYDSTNKLVLYSEQVGAKTNEITPAVKIANRLNFSGCIVTTDALITRKRFVTAVVASHGNYLLAVKGNHELLEQAIEEAFFRNEIIEQGKRDENVRIVGRSTWPKRKIFEEKTDLGHGRIEQRITEVLPADTMSRTTCEGWDGLWFGTIAKVSSSVVSKKNGQSRKDTRFYICSLPFDMPEIAQLLNKTARNHWAIENNLHHVLDVDMDQDKIQSITPNFISNMVSLRKIALNYLTSYQNITRQLKGLDRNPSINLRIKSACTPEKAIEVIRTVIKMEN